MLSVAFSLLGQTASRRCLAIVLCGSCLGPVTGYAQTADDGGQLALERFERQLEQIRRELEVEPPEGVSIGQRAILDFGGYGRAAAIVLDDSVGNTRFLRQYSLTVYGQAKLDEV
ncbi:MAG: hypothetical protein ACFB21_12995, partial [Opitutales bacterium]